MARLSSTVAPGHWTNYDRGCHLTCECGDDIRKHMKLEDDSLKSLIKQSEIIYPEGSLVGALVSFPVGDGTAKYVVTSMRPLAMQHVPHGDSYRIPDAYIRGLRVEDIRKGLRFEKFWRDLANEKSNGRD